MIRSRWEHEFTTKGGDLGVVDAKRAHHPTIDIEAIGKDCVDMAKRKPVSNITGLFIAKVQAAVRQAYASAGIPQSPAERRELAERGAAWAVQFYQWISEQGLPPNRVADLIEQASKDGIQINPLVVDRLREMGHQWPGRA